MMRSRCMKSGIWLVVAALYLVIFVKMYFSNQHQVDLKVLLSSWSLDERTQQEQQQQQSFIGNMMQSMNKSNGSDRSEPPTVYTERRSILTKACNATWRRQHTLDDRGLRNQFSLDVNHKLVYCGIPKVGSTFWKRVLQITSGKKKETNPFDISAPWAHDSTLENFNDKSFDQIHQILSSSTKFVFVREPYSRLFSCYVDKVFTPRPELLGLRKHIIEVAREKDTGNVVANSTCAVHITFSEFLKFVTYAVANKKWIDFHYIPMYDLCRPCEIQYDIVGKMETFMEDAGFVLRQKGLENDIELSQERSDSDAIKDVVDSIFAERTGIEKEKCMTFGEGLSLVWKKLVIRGILAKEEMMPKRFLEGEAFSKADFQQAMDDAYKRSASKPARLDNRKEALIEAFRNISKEDLNKYLELFRPDFDIFGYNADMANISSTNQPNDGYSYLS